MKKIFFLGLILNGIIFLVGCLAVLAYQIEDIGDVVNQGDFVLGPAKIEVWLEPGETTVKELHITNRLGKAMGFKVEVEDFTGSQNPDLPVVFLGQEKGSYSLKDYLKPEINEFVLNHGQQMALPIEIYIPEDAEPGGLYGAVLVLTYPQAAELGKETEIVEGGVKSIARLASLFFIRVKGEVEEQGLLKNFKLVGPKKSFYQKGPFQFELLFQNEGNVHLIPYGLVEIFNTFGQKVKEIEIDPYFVMPESLRSREVKWEKGWGFGKYQAVASINRGYGNIIDQKSLFFWVVPWKIIGGLILALIIVIWFLTKVARRFEIKIKPERR